MKTSEPDATIIVGQVAGSYGSKTVVTAGHLFVDMDNDISADYLAPGRYALVRLGDNGSAATPTTCAFGDPTCPCQDGDLCHYVDDGASKAMGVLMTDKEQTQYLPEGYLAQYGRRAPDEWQKQQNIDADHILCKRCDGTGNELYFMYRRCINCRGDGVQA